MGHVVNSDLVYDFEEKVHKDHQRRILSEQVAEAEALLFEREMAVEMAREALELLRSELEGVIDGA